ncbi:hypothetical protein Pmani_007997 [Petrolisthes manimaculis]|uniref:Transcription elongation factor, mitochondrial n=1 Tax=Petrolisthes manimaculis TaxID=1843537 RepID=A0AAE1Q9S9_9EUCA|nr:hypothetical protein Pmani_007997 [Petrolisthes manimaculis]
MLSLLGNRVVLRIFKNAAYCTSVKSNDAFKVRKAQYDLSTYTFPYTTDEQTHILTRVNQITADELSRLKLTKRVIQRIVRSKTKVGNYRELPELLNIDGLGVRDVESLCDALLYTVCQQQESHNEPELLRSSILKKRLIKPRLSSEALQRVETVVGLNVTAGFLGWANIHRSGVIQNLDTVPLLTSGSRYDLPRIYDRVMEVGEGIPKADVYVWEEGNSTGHLIKAPHSTLIIALQLAQIRGMLTVLLESRCEVEKHNDRNTKNTNLIFMKDFLVPRLFKLQRGEERQSPLSLSDKLMEGRDDVLPWLEALEVDGETQHRYFDMETHTRRYTASAVLVALAFQQVVIAENVGTFKLLVGS